MALAHICPCCGINLERIRASPDGVYGLPVVVCPGCQAAWVRRRHPQWAWWRGCVRGITGVRKLMVRVVVVLGMSGLCAGLAHSGSFELSRPTQAALRGDFLPLIDWFSGDGQGALVVSMLGLVTLIGLVLRVLLDHWSRWALMVLWAGLVAFWGLLPHAQYHLERCVKWMEGEPVVESNWLQWSPSHPHADAMVIVILAGVFGLTVLPGLVLGESAIRARENWRRRRRSKMRAKRKAIRVR